MFKKISLLLIALLLITFSGCELQTRFSGASRSEGMATRAASSADATFFPLFQLFLGISNSDCDTKVNNMISHFFYGNDSSERIYYPVEVEGQQMAYILDTGNGDVRSEGMSYGMMICVQLSMRDEFDRLWRWAKRFMLHTWGDRAGYFRWNCNTDGSEKDPNPAPDGEEYFAMALYFAHNRWGSTTTLPYETDADNILTAMLNNSRGGGITAMFGNNDLVCFVPDGDNADFTDPSYHLPAFYELFAQFGPEEQKERWQAIAAASRQYLRDTILKSKTGGGANEKYYGLVPDYTDYNGNGKDILFDSDGNGTNDATHADFNFDAWRTVMNVVIDSIFSEYEPLQQYGQWPTKWIAFWNEYVNALLGFFQNDGTGNPHGNRYTIYGQRNSSPPNDHSAGLVAMNALAARVSTDWDMIIDYANEFWDLALPSGQWRYYDGCLYMLSMLFCTGNYNIIDPGNQLRPLANKINPVYDTISLSNSWSGKHLTVTDTYSNADVKCQPENSGWTSQDWVIEKVSGSNRVRLRNVWSGKYLHVQNEYENAKVVCYDFVPDWWSEQWIIEPVSGTGSVRLKNAWSGRYLTVEDTGDYANIWSQSLNTGWTSQCWVIQ